jgi:hypothetical protein
MPPVFSFAAAAAASRRHWLSYAAIDAFRFSQRQTLSDYYCLARHIAFAAAAFTPAADAADAA